MYICYRKRSTFDYKTVKCFIFKNKLLKCARIVKRLLIRKNCV